MGKKTAILSIVIVMLLISAGAVSATKYISDQLAVNMRRGPSTSYAIIELVESGTRVETLGQTNGWTRVRTPSGDVGYVLTRLLSTQPAARQRLQKVEAKLAQLKKENRKLHSRLEKALQATQKLSKRKQTLAAENEALRAKLQHIKAISENAMQLKKQNQAYREKLQALKSKLEQLRAKNNMLQSRRKGMIMGAGILVIGILIGIILPYFRRRRKSSWDSL